MEDGRGLSYEYSFDKSRGEFFVRKTSGENTVIEEWYNVDGIMIRRDIGGLTEKTVTVENGSTSSPLSGDIYYIVAPDSGGTKYLYPTRRQIHKDWNGNSTIVEYDGFARITKKTYSDNTTERFEYDPNFSQLSRYIDQNGIVTRYEFDARGNITRIIEADGRPEQRVIEYTYDQYGNQRTIREIGDANTQEAYTQYFYDNQGNLIREIDAENNESTADHDIMGNVTLYTDKRGNDWVREYNNKGWITLRRSPEGLEQIYEYDGRGNLTRYLNQELRETRYEYNSYSRMMAIIDHLGNRIQATRNLDDRVTEVIDRNGKRYTYTYDLQSRFTSQTDGNNNRTGVQYPNEPAPGAGTYNHRSRIDYPTYTQLFQYDNRNRMSQNTLMLGTDGQVTSYGYDAKGRLASYTDPEAKTTLLDYDVFDNLVTYDTAGYISRGEYDNRDNLLVFFDDNQNPYRFGYDRKNQFTSFQMPMGEITQYIYNPAGNITEVIYPELNKTVFGYDNDGRIASINYYTASDYVTPQRTIIVTWTPTGNLETLTEGSVSSSYIYDDLQRLTSETVNYGPFSLTHAYTYYANGQRETYTDPQGTTYTYLYDDNNQFVAMIIPGEGTVTVDNYLWQAPTSMTLPGGARRQFSYNGLLSPTSIRSEDAAQNVLYSLGLDYNNVQNITSKTSDNQQTDYSYNDKYQLTEALQQTAGTNEYFTLDDAGNRIGYNGATWVVNANNELEDSGFAQYQYNANGYRTQKSDASGIIYFYYDLEGRLVRVENGSNSIIAEYGYDPFDRRLWKEVGGVRTYYAYSLDGLSGEYDAAGNLIRSYGYKPGSLWTTDPIFMAEGSTYYYYHNDHLGTPQKITNKAGSIVWSALYPSYGAAAVNPASTITNNLRFAGQYYDSETGLHYNYRRYYDPQAGVYLTPDPLGFGGGDNFYSYAGANPINLIDPYGECGLVGAGVGAIGGALWCGVMMAFDPCYTMGDCLMDIALGAAGGATCGAGWIGNATSKGLGLANRANKARKPGKVADGLGGRGGPRGNGGSGANCGVNSFTPDTLVHTKEGPRPIKDIKVGDEVLAYAEWSGEQSYQKVEAVITNEKVYELFAITLENGDVIDATDGHPFNVYGIGWRDAKLLQKGQRLYLSSKGLVTIKSISSTTKHTRVYNLTVANAHTFYVGEEGVLVHNCNKVPGPDEGVIYRVPGEYTPSGKPYVGSADDLAKRAKGARDGRDRDHAEIIDRYKKGDRNDRRRREQLGIDNNGGVNNLDNKRNEIAPRNRSDYGLPPL
jgi:RHS repeat-associated protein